MDKEDRVKNRPDAAGWRERCLVQVAVMLLCFYLYYLGFFGGVEGPLSADSLAGYLVGWGITRQGLAVFLLLLAMVAMTWNWVYNSIRWFYYQSLKQGSKGRQDLRPLTKGVWANLAWLLLLAMAIIVWLA